jgi:arginase family enzyme
MSEVSLHLDLDGAWPADALPIRTVDLRSWGPRLRYITAEGELRAFARELPPDPARFFLYGSGDFHHISAVLVRRSAELAQRPIRVVCFDNHPDWDVRPPRWGCGTWVNRALESAGVERVSVWGCGNFEMNPPHRWFRNRAALQLGRLEIYPWLERESAGAARRFPGVSRDNWRAEFDRFASEQQGAQLYVTVDMDCLQSTDACTDWESGLFSAEDVAWAISRLRQTSTIVAGDVCGATSPAVYAGAFQRFAGWWDHPRLPAVNSGEAMRVNVRSLRTIWPMLTVIV